MKVLKVFLLITILIIFQINLALASENNRPVLQLEFEDLETNPQVDIYLVLEQSVDESISNKIEIEVNNLNNQVRLLGLDSELNIWNLKDKEIKKVVTDSKSTGSSYPPDTISYDLDGYVGMLDRVSVDNDSYSEDRGEYVTYTESKTVTDTLTTYAQTYYDEAGNVLFKHTPSNPTINYSSDGFEGTLTKYNVILIDTTYDYYPSGVVRTKVKEYRGYYTGVVTKTVTEWESDWHTVDDYTGYYEGEVIKTEKSRFDNKFRTLSDKYTLYVSNNNFDSLEELALLESIADCENYLIASEDYSSLNYLSTEDFEQGWESFLNILENKYTDTVSNKVLIDQVFKVVSEISDSENDPISLSQTQLIHDPNIYDNNTGLENSSYSEYKEANYKNGSFSGESSLSKKGLYKMYQRVKDSPLNNPEIGLYSNEEVLELFVHEKPVALCDVLYKYDEINESYEITFNDKSFDPDYQYRRSDKGISDTKVKYEAEGKTKHTLPKSLSPGEYVFEYYAKDIDSVWSEPFILELSLDDNPKISTRFDVYYKCGDDILYFEQKESIIDLGSSQTETFYAKDYLPAYQLISADTITKTVDGQNQVAKVNFYYEKVERNPQVDIDIVSDKMRADNTIAAGYGFEVKASLNNIDTEGIVVKTKWLENQSYEWVHQNTYMINNLYDMESISNNEFILCPNTDSANKVRQVFIPVELNDGLYQGEVIVDNIKKPIYEIDQEGILKHIDNEYITITTPFNIRVRGTMYEDFNIVN